MSKPCPSAGASAPVTVSRDTSNTVEHRTFTCSHCVACQFGMTFNTFAGFATDGADVSAYRAGYMPLEFDQNCSDAVASWRTFRIVGESKVSVALVRRACVTVFTDSSLICCVLRHPMRMPKSIQFASDCRRACDATLHSSAKARRAQLDAVL